MDNKMNKIIKHLFKMCRFLKKKIKRVLRKIKENKKENQNLWQKYCKIGNL